MAAEEALAKEAPEVPAVLASAASASVASVETADGAPAESAVASDLVCIASHISPWSRDRWQTLRSASIWCCRCIPSSSAAPVSAAPAGSEREVPVASVLAVRAAAGLVCLGKGRPAFHIGGTGSRPGTAGPA